MNPNPTTLPGEVTLILLLKCRNYHETVTPRGTVQSQTLGCWEQSVPTSVILEQISVSRSPGLLSGVLRKCGRSSDFRVQLMAMRKSLAW